MINRHKMPSYFPLHFYKIHYLLKKEKKIQQMKSN